MKDHLRYELMGGEPTVVRGGKSAAKAAIFDMGTHVGIDAETVAVLEKGRVELSRQVVDVDIWAAGASGAQMSCPIGGISSLSMKIIGRETNVEQEKPEKKGKNKKRIVSEIMVEKGLFNFGGSFSVKKTRNWSCLFP